MLIDMLILDISDKYLRGKMDNMPPEIVTHLSQYLSSKDLPLLYEAFQIDSRKKVFLEIILTKTVRLYKEICHNREHSYII